MTKPIIRIHNTAIDEVIDREMTDAEYKDWLERKAIDDAKNDENQKMLEAKKTLLEKLGITEDEAKLLLS